MIALIGLVFLALAGAVLLAARNMFAKPTGHALRDEFGAMMSACLVTGLFAFGVAELIYGLAHTSGMTSLLEGAMVVVGLVAIVVVTVVVARRHAQHRGIAAH